MPGTKGFRYVYSQGQITKVLEKIRALGRPDKLTFPYMRDTWLLKNAQYGDVLVILRDMGFIDNVGVPTGLYGEYQNPPLAKQALAKGVKSAYFELFKAYPKANTLPRADLEGYLRQHTGKSGSVLEKMLLTFKTLCSHADFTGGEAVPKEPEAEAEPEVVTGEERRIKVEPKIQLNIEIHIAPDTPDDKIKKIFENMKTYLLPNE